MGSISADGGKGGDVYGGGTGGQGGKGGHVSMINLGIMNLARIIQNNETNIIVQKFDEVIDEIEREQTLNSQQKSHIKMILGNLKSVFISAEPIARPYIVKALESLALSGT